MRHSKICMCCAVLIAALLAFASCADGTPAGTQAGRESGSGLAGTGQSSGTAIANASTGEPAPTGAAGTGLEGGALNEPERPGSVNMTEAAQTGGVAPAEADQAGVAGLVGSDQDSGALIRVENSPLTYALPLPVTEGDVSVEEALASRRSRRSYQDRALSAEQLSQILWAAYGITEPGRGYRTSPSAGALYPLEIYVVVGNVAGIEAGLYKYDAEGHKITRTIDGDIRDGLSAAALNQAMIRSAPVTVVYTAVFSRITGRYGERGRERFVYMEIGHSAQNVYLQAEALGLGTCAVGAFTDGRVSEVLSLAADEEPLYMMPVGYATS